MLVEMAQDISNPAVVMVTARAGQAGDVQPYVLDLSVDVRFEWELAGAKIPTRLPRGLALRASGMKWWLGPLVRV